MWINDVGMMSPVVFHKGKTGVHLWDQEGSCLEWKSKIQNQVLQVISHNLSWIYEKAKKSTIKTSYIEDVI